MKISYEEEFDAAIMELDIYLEDDNDERWPDWKLDRFTNLTDAVIEYEEWKLAIKESENKP